MLIDNELASIQEECQYKLSKEQLAVIRKYLASYALAAVMDSQVRAEAEQVASEAQGGL